MEPKIQSCDPLTTEEVTALEPKLCPNLIPEIERLFATIRDRERERDELQRKLDEDQEQNDKLMAYARKVAGRRDVHSVYEVLDQVTELQRRVEECERRLNG